MPGNRRVVHALILILVAVVGITLIYNYTLKEGTIEGTVTIGPWTPVEPPGGSRPPPEVFTSRRIILEGSLFSRIEVPINGSGFFRAHVKAGAYRLTMTNCTFMGCVRALPVTVTVRPGETTSVNIDIDTGIR